MDEREGVAMKPEARDKHFLDEGWLKIDLYDTSPIWKIRELLLKRLQEKWRLADLKRLEDYHLFVDSDNNHTAIQYDLLQLYLEAHSGLEVIRKNKKLLIDLIGPDIHVSKYPYLRIARPNKRQDNVGYHRDTFYGCSPFELSVFVPFVDLSDPDATLKLIPGSHIMPESAFSYKQIPSETVSKGSAKHQLGFLYSPKIMEGNIDNRAVPIPLEIGQVLIFSLSIVHGQEVNRSQLTRFSSDIRVVNSLAPIEWERSVHKDYYVELSSSAVTKQARAYQKANAPVTNDNNK